MMTSINKDLIEDLKTHRDAWRAALKIAINASQPSTEDSNDAGYWRKELKVFDRTMVEVDKLITSVSKHISFEDAVGEYHDQVVKKCPHCFKAIKGHPNKKFCNQKCKDTFHNQKNEKRMIRAVTVSAGMHPSAAKSFDSVVDAKLQRLRLAGRFDEADEREYVGCTFDDFCHCTYCLDY